MRRMSHALFCRGTFRAIRLVVAILSGDERATVILHGVQRRVRVARRRGNVYQRSLEKRSAAVYKAEDISMTSNEHQIAGPKSRGPRKERASARAAKSSVRF